AYASWIAALGSGHIDPAGHAFAAQLLAEARQQAAEFLAAQPALAAAADAFARVAAAAGELTERTPFPPTRPLDNLELAAAAQLLARARDAEARGLSALEAAAAARARAAAEEAYTIEDASATGDLFFCLADVPVGGLAPAADRCRRELAPRLGRSFHAKLARERATGAIVG